MVGIFQDLGLVRDGIQKSGGHCTGFARTAFDRKVSALVRVCTSRNHDYILDDMQLMFEYPV
jgi:hypothetical protein